MSENKQKLTKRLIDSLKTAENGKRYYIQDTEIPGFGIIVSATCVTYFMEWREGSGGRKARKHRVKIGRAGEITPDQAREIAQDMRADIRKGKNPAEERQRDRENPTVEEMIKQDYYPKHLEVRNKPTTINSNKQSLEKNVIPEIGTKRVRDVTMADIQKIVDTMTARGAATQANRMRMVISKVMNLCEKWGYRDPHTNPCRFVEKNPELERERYLTEKELPLFLTTLYELRENGTIPANCADIYLLLLLTGARSGEIMFLKLSELELDKARIVKQDHKTATMQKKKKRDRVIFLNQLALAVVNNALRRKAEEDKKRGREPEEFPYVFESNKRPGQPYNNIQKPWRVLRKKIGCPDLHIHDLRHTHASILYNQTQSLGIIKRLLGHTQSRTTERYTHMFTDPLLEASEQVSKVVGAHITVDSSADIIQMPARQKHGKKP